MPELVLYGIRELAEQFLGPLLDIEVDHSASLSALTVCPRPRQPIITMIISTKN